MQIDHHPKYLLKEDWINILRKYSKEAEQTRELHPEQIKLIYKNDWLKALVPKHLGGLEWTLPQIVSFEEAIGWAEGSCGWLFTLCSGAGWFSGFLNKDFAEDIFAIENICIAGSGAVTGVAKPLNNDSYLVSGNWKYATGAIFADVFTANCFIEEEQKVKAFCFLKNEVSVSKTWNPIGLIATASESFSVYNLVVAKSRVFEIDPEKSMVDIPLYKYPFRQLAESTIAANISGMALHFMEECEAYFKTKNRTDKSSLWENEKIQNAFFTEIKALNDARKNLSHAVDISWNELTGQRKISDNIMEEVSTFSQQLAKVCRAAVNNLYSFTGLSGASYNSAVNRVWRDFQTGSQHAVFMDI